MGNVKSSPVLSDKDVAVVCNTTGMERDLVLKAFSAFIEEHPKGRIEPKDFSKMMTKKMDKKAASKIEKHVFRIFNSKKDGYIDFIEFMLIFYTMANGKPEDVIKMIFGVFDINGDGTIDEKEMRRLVKDMYDLIKADDSETQSRDLIARCVFTEMDANGDGKITLDEFVAACFAQEELSKMLVLKVMDVLEALESSKITSMLKEEKIENSSKLI